MNRGWRTGLLAVATLGATPALSAEQPTYDQCELKLSDVKGAPRFDQYPAQVETIAHPAKPQLRAPLQRAFKTRIRRTAEGPPNLAGHYTLNDWGCGTDCGMFAIVDLRTGAVTFTNATGSVGHTPMTPRVQTQANSRLVVATGAPSELSKWRPALRFYEWTGRSLNLLKTYSYKQVCKPDPPD